MSLVNDTGNGANCGNVADEGNWVEKGFHWARAVERGYTQARRALGREEA